LVIQFLIQPVWFPKFYANKHICYNSLIVPSNAHLVHWINFWHSTKTIIIKHRLKLNWIEIELNWNWIDKLLKKKLYYEVHINCFNNTFSNVVLPGWMTWVYFWLNKKHLLWNLQLFKTFCISNFEIFHIILILKGGTAQFFYPIVQLF
jgi:hypothetical protein